MEDDDRMVLVAVEAVDAILGVDRDRPSVYLNMLWRALPIPMNAIAVVTLGQRSLPLHFPSRCRFARAHYGSPNSTAAEAIRRCVR